MLYDGTKARDLFFELYDWLKYKTYEFMACNEEYDDDPLKETEQIIHGQVVDFYGGLLFGREDLGDHIRAVKMKDKLRDFYYIWCEMRRLCRCFADYDSTGEEVLNNCDKHIYFTGNRKILVIGRTDQSTYFTLKQLVLKYVNDGYPDNDIDEKNYLDVINSLISKEIKLKEECAFFNEIQPYIKVKSSSYKPDEALNVNKDIKMIYAEEFKMFDMLYPGQRFNRYLTKNFYDTVVSSVDYISNSIKEVKETLKLRNVSLEEWKINDCKEQMKPLLNSVERIEESLKNYKSSQTIKNIYAEKFIKSKQVWKLYTDLVASTEVLYPKNFVEYKTMLMSPGIYSVDDLNSCLKWPKLNKNLLSLVNGLNDLYIVLDKIKVQHEN